MKKLVCVLSLLMFGCNSCYVEPPATGPKQAPSHDVVAMDAVPAPAPTTPASAVPPPPAPPPKAVARHVLIIGDSEACAVAPVAREVARAWADKHGQPVDDVAVECKGGTVIQYWGPGGHARSALQAHPKTDTLVVFLGTNHYWQKPLNGDPKLILDLVADRGLQCVWVGNVAVKGRKWPVNGDLRQAVTPTCNYFNAEEEPIQLWDGVHPDRANARIWLADVWEAIPLKYEDTHD